MHELLKSSNCLSTALKKTRATLNMDSSGEKDLIRLETDKKLNKKQPYQQDSKRNFDLLETKLTDHNQNALFVNRKSLKIKGQLKQNLIQKKEKQVTVEQILSRCGQICQIYYENEQNKAINQKKGDSEVAIDQFNLKFRSRCLKILKNLKQRPKQLTVHLNKIFYSSASIKMLSLSEIERQIMKNWKENNLLVLINMKWMTSLQQVIPRLQENKYYLFKELIYEKYCEFMSHLTFIIFEPYYTSAVGKTGGRKEDIIRSIYWKAIRFVVTQTSEWSNIAYFYLQEIAHTNKQQITISLQQEHELIQSLIAQIRVAPIQKLLIRKHNEGQILFPATKASMSRFVNEHYLPHKLKAIVKLRSALEQDILTYEKQLIQNQEMNDIEILEKDPMLTSLILAILSGKTKMANIQVAILEVELLLGQNINKILQAYQCPSYFADLKSSIQFLNAQLTVISKTKKNQQHCVQNY